MTRAATLEKKRKRQHELQMQALKVLEKLPSDVLEAALFAGIGAASGNWVESLVTTGLWLDTPFGRISTPLLQSPSAPGGMTQEERDAWHQRQNLALGAIAGLGMWLMADALGKAIELQSVSGKIGLLGG